MTVVVLRCATHGGNYHSFSGEQFGRTNQNILDTRISFLPSEVVIIMCLADAVLCFLIRKRGESYISTNKKRYHNSWAIPFLRKNQGSLSKQK